MEYSAKLVLCSVAEYSAKTVLCSVAEYSARPVLYGVAEYSAKPVLCSVAEYSANPVLYQYGRVICEARFEWVEARSTLFYVVSIMTECSVNPVLN